MLSLFKNILKEFYIDIRPCENTVLCKKYWYVTWCMCADAQVPAGED